MYSLYIELSIFTPEKPKLILNLCIELDNIKNFLSCDYYTTEFF